MIKYEEVQKAKQNERAVAAQEAMQRLVNTFGDGNMDAFIALMSVEHRTLQQSFTKLVFKWLELLATEGYPFDQRNENAVSTSKMLLDLFRKYNQEHEGYTGATLDMMSKPSGYMNMI